MTLLIVHIQECPEDDDYVEIKRSDRFFKALKLFPWKNPNCQFAFFVSAKHWLPHARIFIRPDETKTGLTVVLIGNEVNYKTVCYVIKPEPNQ